MVEVYSKAPAPTNHEWKCEKKWKRHSFKQRGIGLFQYGNNGDERVISKCQGKNWKLESLFALLQNSVLLTSWPALGKPISLGAGGRKSEEHPLQDSGSCDGIRNHCRPQESKECDVLPLQRSSSSSLAPPPLPPHMLRAVTPLPQGKLLEEQL